MSYHLGINNQVHLHPFFILHPSITYHNHLCVFGIMLTLSLLQSAKERRRDRIESIKGLVGINEKKIKGKIVVMRKNFLDFVALGSSVVDKVHELLGQKVSVQLISATNGHPKGKLGKAAYIDDWITGNNNLFAGKSASLQINFEWEDDFGLPGAFIIKNFHFNEFFLVSLTLENVPEHGRVHFDCNSWVYPVGKYKKDRIFFSNESYLPNETPIPLRQYREKELANLRGDGTGKRQEWDRIYDYDYYNDLGKPDNGPDHVRPILGGHEHPYPRRGRTGREPTKTDPKSESGLPLLLSINVYVPRDERFGHLKMSDFVGYALKSLSQALLPLFEALVDGTPGEYDNMKETFDLYEGGLKLPSSPMLDQIKDNIPLELLKEVIRTDGEGYFRFPTPHVIKEDRSAWRTDEEFGREMLAGVNPVVISRLTEFPPRSTLDPQVYGNQHSTITEEHIKNNVDGLSVSEALKKNRLFILNHHDALMPYLRRINTGTGTRTYATRTLLFLKSDGTLKPLAIELSLPHSRGDQFGCKSKVYTPEEHGVQGTIWQLAKAYAAVNDSGYHQLISHWLNTHAVIEPFVIATNRHLSVLHPIYKLLQPHYRDTMNINALARQTLINAGGILERTVYPGKYALEMSSAVYKNWIFTEQSLPADLLKRGVAVEDKSCPHGLRLLIEDYPFAVDGLEIWSAIETWVSEFVHFYYDDDEMVQNDHELQAWWTEVREEGHGDKKDETWWPAMHTRQELIHSCSIIIWVASALHAAVNFGQYPFAGYLPNRPTVSRRFMPKPGSPEYAELETDPERAFLKTITAQLQTLLGVSLIEILSRHASDELYLGQRASDEWTTDDAALLAFEKFGKTLAGIEKRIVERNNNKKLKNRAGPVKMPYTLLHPTSEPGLTAKGIPNSISI